MSSIPASPATLRLTGGPSGARRALSVPVSRTFAPTATTIPEGSTVDAADPRWGFAVRAASRLQGGAAAILAPEDRAILGDLARRLGLRAFDASLIIAIVQDAARSGMDPLGVATEDGLAMIRPAERAGGLLAPLVWSLVLGG